MRIRPLLSRQLREPSPGLHLCPPTRLINYRHSVRHLLRQLTSPSPVPGVPRQRTGQRFQEGQCGVRSRETGQQEAMTDRLATFLNQTAGTRTGRSLPTSGARCPTGVAPKVDFVPGCAREPTAYSTACTSSSPTLEAERKTRKMAGTGTMAFRRRVTLQSRNFGPQS